MIRNGKVFVNCVFRTDVEVRVHHGQVREVGCGLAKGLYEEEVDLAGDYLLPGFVDVHACVWGGCDETQQEDAVRTLSRALFRQGVAAFRLCLAGMSPEDDSAAPEGVRRVMQRPEHRGALVLGVHLGALDEDGAALTMPQRLEKMVRHDGVAAAEAVLLCTAIPAESVGESLAGRICAGAPAPLTRWSADWRWKGILA